MRIISDIEIHSKYSRACSPELTPENIGKWAEIKGVDLIGTGDFTHPEWLAELEQALVPAEAGFFQLKSGESKARFILTAEVSCIFSQNDRVRRVHLLLYSPSFVAVKKFNQTLVDHGGKLGSDGRPILGMSCEEILKYLLAADSENVLIPAHVWTPYFGIFGSKSGFDSIDEAFGEMSKHVFAIETGLSSDPEMNWQISGHDRLTLVSSSDAHSLPRIGREANVMEIPDQEKLTYQEFMRIIRENDRERFKYTIEYFPEEGKYHLDGHADCKFSCEPEETEKHKGRCPKCGKKIIEGALSRVKELADRERGYKRPDAIPGRHLVPLEEVLAECTGRGVKTKTVQDIYWRLIEKAGNEFAVILDLPISEVKAAASKIVAEAVRRVRNEEVNLVPGYDGVYGQVKIFSDEERDELLGKVAGKQKALF